MNEEIKDLVISRLAASDAPSLAARPARSPVHVMYGGAHLFRSDTPAKLGRLAKKSLETYAPNFAEFARAVWLVGADGLPKDRAGIQDLEFLIADDPVKSKTDEPDGWFAWSVFQRTLDKLINEPVEDYRIDFEDGYGIRTDSEEDEHCISASRALADLLCGAGDDPVKLIAGSPATGFRIKSLQPETRHRAIRTFNLFLSNLLKHTDGLLPEGFVITLPKIKSPAETEALTLLLDDFEKTNGLRHGFIGVEILIETPESIPVIREIAEGCGGRCISAHFGTYDFTSSLGVTAEHQHVRHEACVFARNMMQVSLSPLGIRLSDSVTSELPVPIHRGESLSIQQIAENQEAVRNAWRKHFNNITHSQINGFFQSWDLHPSQLVARYAAVYSFFLNSLEPQAKRLNGLLEKAAQALITGNVFDDLASAEGLLNFFAQGVQCGAFTSVEAARATSLSESELESASFAEVIAGRFGKQA